VVLATQRVNTFTMQLTNRSGGDPLLSIYRDTETIGCDPSLSSIPVGEQRSLDSAFQVGAQTTVGTQTTAAESNIAVDCADAAGVCVDSGASWLLEFATQEIADWMAAPGNEDEFVTLFFDDQSGRLGELTTRCCSTSALFPRRT
jgi:hypothetical protein